MTDALVSQAPVETLVGSTELQGLVAQTPIETLVGSTGLQGRVFQCAIEALVKLPTAVYPPTARADATAWAPTLVSGAARVSQAPMEVLVQSATLAGRISQGPIEALVQSAGLAGRISQAPIEILVQLRTGRRQGPAVGHI